MPGKSLDTVGVLSNNTYFYVLDNHNKFMLVKQAEGLSADSLMKTCKIMFAEHGLPRKIKSDASVIGWLSHENLNKAGGLKYMNLNENNAYIL